MATTIPALRLQLADGAPRQFGGLLGLAGASPIDPTLRDLIDSRASQINGCVFCLDMHWKDGMFA
jgi:alkylhydroperoxidase family enzyme